MPVARYFDQLSKIAQHGKIWLVPGPPPSHLFGTQEMTAADFANKVIKYSGKGLFIEPQEHLIIELREQLAVWRAAL